ncbi:MAG: hypothetical protein LH473_06225 [Chitinophagales bacterium]|nr:hypothetical protein [Chitinophagales bacterium]
MIALPLCIILSTYLVICFKYFQKFGVNNLQAIVFNYVTCVITGIVYSKQVPDVSLIIETPWFPVAVILGCCFFLIFNLMGYVASNIGITVTSVASKLSMVIPVTAAIILYNESFSFLKIIALLLGFVAVYFSSLHAAPGESHIDFKGLLLAFIIFIGSGLNDTLVNYGTRKLMLSSEFENFNISIFAFAALAGIIVMLYQSIALKKPIPIKAVIAGIVLGVPNYFSLLFLMKALNIPEWNSSVIIPINNMGIVVLSAVSAFLLFKEKLSIANLAGIMIGLIAIGIMLIA